MEETVTVKVIHGLLKGRKTKTFAGRPYYSFQGIPYAQPPVGHLRFKAPVPLEPWEGIKDALKCGASAPQEEEMFFNKYLGEEDCLFLNVYTPQLPQDVKENHKMSVMVFIHGGAFVVGSGNDDIYHPDHLMTADVVLVTFNYRLGALGFLSTGDAHMPGNFGLKDQVMALRWVQDNISRFCGDSNDVTVFGQSAGACSVHYHMMSPMSKGLFHKAIGQSGSAFCPWAYSSSLRERVFKLGEALGCTTTDSREVVEFLRTVPVKDLVKTGHKLKTAHEKLCIEMFYTPCIETEVPNDEEPFLATDPRQLIKEGKFQKIPFMLGHTSNEGMFVLRILQLLKELKLGAEMVLIPYWNKLQRNSPEAKDMALKFKEFYFGGEPQNPDYLPQLSDIWGDGLFTYGVNKAVDEHVKISDSPVYLYQFSFEEDFAILKHILGGQRLPGVCHSGDIPYLWKGFYVEEEKLQSDSNHMKVVTMMIKLWTNFAKTGNPTPNGDKDIGVKWETVTKSEKICLDIDLTPTLKTNIKKERFEFWDEIIDQL